MSSNVPHQSLFHPSPSAAVSPSQIDVIPDSEPERVEMKRRLKEQRRKLKMESVTARELRADEERNDKGRPATGLPTPSGVIYTSDHSNIPESSVLKHIHERNSDIASPPPAPTEKADHSTSSVQSTTLHGSPQVARTINFSQFAYHGAKLGHLGSFGTTPSMSRSASTSSFTPTADPHPLRPTLPMVPKKKGRMGVQPTYSFTDEQWTQLCVCVCCDEKWTARKSVKGKMTHLKSCAKDAFMSDELVEKKILEELQNPYCAPESKKGTSTKSSAPASTLAASGLGTLLEDVVNETGVPKKKARRPAAAAISVKNASDTREAIRRRAQVFLEPNARDHTPEAAAATTSAFPQNSLFSTRGTIDKDIDQNFDVPSTQVLPPSRLALRSAASRAGGILFGQGTSPPKPHVPSAMGVASYRTVSPTLNDSNESESTIGGSDVNTSPTHNFSVNSETYKLVGPSKITSFFPSQKRSRARTSKPSSKLTSKRVKSPVVISLLSSDDSGSSSDRSLPHLSEKQKRTPEGATSSPLQTPSRSQSSSPVQQEALRFDPGWRNDEWGTNAYLEWDGVDREVNVVMDESVSDPSLVPSRSSSPRTTKKNRSPSPNRKGKARAKPTSKNKRSKPARDEDNLVPLSNETEVNELLKTMITIDEELYLRVLRYEPINFEVFYDLAIAHNLQPRGLRLKLRDFLDSQNIAFQASAPTAKARRRR